MVEAAHPGDGHRVSVQFQLTRTEFETFARWLTRRSPIVRRIAFVVGGPLVIGVVLAIAVSDVYGLALIAVGLLEAIIVSVLLLSAPRRAWRKTTSDLRASQTIQFSEAGIHSQSVNAEADARWAIYPSAVEHQDLYLLSTRRRTWVIIPKRAFTSHADESRFRQLITDHASARLS